MKKIRIAQIGAAHLHAGAAYNAILKNPEHFELVGLAVPKEEQDEKHPFYKRYKNDITHSVEEILSLPDLDAVAIEVSEKNLSKYALMAAKRGLHLYLDKPGGAIPEEFEELIETVKKNKAVLHMGYMYRYNPAFIELLEKVRRGDIGDVFSIDAQMSCYCDSYYRAWLGEIPGGMMFNLGCHLIDMVLQIQGEPEEIIPLNASSGTDGIHTTDLGLAALRYKNGVSTVKTSAVERGGFVRRQFNVFGTKGTIELRPIERDATGAHDNSQLCTDIYETYSTDWVTVPEHHTTKIYDRYSSMMLSFASEVRGENENPYTPDYELLLYRTLMKCCGVANK